MKRLYTSLLLLAFFITTASLMAQTRYLNQVFNSVTTKINQPYGLNTTVLAFPTLIKQPLIMDVYEPSGDTEPLRPIVLYLHTGNFLPFKHPTTGDLGANGSCGGTLRDSVAIEICTRLAKMGYVAASLDYRLGWNPVAPTEVDRRYGIINAAYRGIQDVRTCVRYLKKSVKEFGNPWKIDTTRIVVWGQGTGGYISMNALFLDNYLKIPTASNGKFLWDHDQMPATPPIPMIIPQVNGDINGTSLGLLPKSTGGFDTLCFPNHVGYNSEFALAVNMGGACADSAWIDKGHKPLISYHVPYDRYAPYDQGIVTVPHPSIVLTVVNVEGSYNVQTLMNKFGNNNSYIGKPGFFDMEVEANKAYANTPKANGSDWSKPVPGLYPFVRPLVDAQGVKVADNTSPWEWSGPVPPNPTCNQNKVPALAYVDTIMRFYAPRGCYALGLSGCINALVGANEPVLDNIEVNIAPNPASEAMTITAAETIQTITVFDQNGRMVLNQQSVNNNTYLFNRNNLNAGLYIVKLNFEKGFTTKIVSFN